MIASLLQPSLGDVFGEALLGLPRLAALLQRVPLPAALVVAAVGLLAMAWGSRQPRALGLLAGAGIGALAAVLAEPWLRAQVGLSGSAALATGAAVLGVASAFFPPIFIFAAGALPLALIGLWFPVHGQPALGLLAGVAVGGVASLLLARLVVAVAAGAVGAALVGAALLAAGGRWPALVVLSRHPFALAVVVAILTVAGAAFQYQRNQSGSIRRWSKKTSASQEEKPKRSWPRPSSGAGSS